MSTNDVPGAVATHNDVLAMGCWAEAAEPGDDSLILVEGVEGGRVIFNIFDLAPIEPTEYRHSMPENVFKDRFSWRPGDGGSDVDNIRWVWHDKTLFPWDRIMGAFEPGQRHVSAQAQLTAAARVARSLDLRAGAITRTAPARTMLDRVGDALQALKK